MEVVKGRSLLFDAARRIYRNRLAMIMFVIIFIYILMALYSAFNVGHIFELATNHIEDVNRSFVPPFQDKSAPLGTDIFGRNVLYRAVYGSKISMYLGFLTILIQIPIAIIMGDLAGYYGGFIDDAIQYLMSIIYSVPGLIIILAFILLMGPSFLTIALAFALTGWVGLARVIRGAFMQAKEFEYVLAARTLGAKDGRIIFKHILPNVFHYVIISAILTFAGVIMSEVLLAYLGLSIVGVPTWGTMIADASQEVSAGRWQNFLGAVPFIWLFILALNLIGDALRDALDPRLRNL
jgi:ABC-type dipeptide/oligopeptide/nickel transport system permease subunit